MQTIRTEEGTYTPGARIEIISGPGAWVRLAQYERQSPHPISWLSSPIKDVAEARRIGLRLRLEDEGDREVPKNLPNLTSIAFERHHAGYAPHDGALGDCNDCYLWAAETIRAAAEELAVWDEWRES